MRKLIEVEHGDVVICDNPSCDFVVKRETEFIRCELSTYLNVPCPKCGENLLTEEDFITALDLLNRIDWINKWFSWITIFQFRRKKSSISVHCHNGVNIKQNVEH